MALWGGRFIDESDELFKKFNTSLLFDYVLAEEEITASISWSKTLMKSNIINKKEQITIEHALLELLKEIQNKTDNILLSNKQL